MAWACLQRYVKFAGARGASQQTPMTRDVPSRTTTIQYKHKQSAKHAKKGKADVMVMGALPEVTCTIFDML